jgi:hypothetical protein
LDPLDLEGVAADAAGGLYVADAGNNRVLHFPSGSTTADRVYGQPTFSSNADGVSATLLSGPISVAVDPDGGLYVGDAQNYLSVHDDRLLHFPAGSATADRVYGTCGSFTSNACPPGSSVNTIGLPSGMAFDSSGGLYVSDFLNNRVLHFKSGSTTPDRVWGQGGPFTGAPIQATANVFSSPFGIATFNGALYVVDFYDNRVLYFPPVVSPATTPAPRSALLTLSGMAAIALLFAFRALRSRKSPAL